MNAEPDLQIGVVEGDPDYQMHVLVSAVALPDGRIAALNAGSYELRVYDAAGRIVARSGRRGGGPGEFQKPIRLYLLDDTLAVYDQGLNRLSLHGLDATYLGARPVPRVQGAFVLDEWLHDMSWIDGPPFGRGRAEVMSAVERLPPPDSAEGYRYVRVTEFGHLWVRQPAVAGASTRTWHVHHLDGDAVARVDVPASFDIFEFGADYLLGRGRDSLDVEYVQLHSLDTHGAALVPHEFSALDVAARERPDSVRSAALNELRGALRMLTGHQEIYYSTPANQYRYADDHLKLVGYEVPDGLVVRIINANTLGWNAIAVHRATRVTCGMAIGMAAPVGWTSGMVMCP